MASNLRAKIPPSDTLVIHDINPAITQKFVEEVGIAAKEAGAPAKGTGIEVASSLRALAEKSVRWITQFVPVISSSDEFVLSMI